MIAIFRMFRLSYIKYTPLFIVIDALMFAYKIFDEATLRV